MPRIDIAQVPEQRVGKILASGEAAKSSKILELGVIARHVVGLLVRNHL